MSKLDDETCWRAVVNRSKDADSRFFYAVKTTGVFCRPSSKPFARATSIWPSITSEST